MQLLNLIRDFKIEKIKELKTIKEYSDMIMRIENRVSLLVYKFKDSLDIEKNLVIVPE